MLATCEHASGVGGMYVYDAYLQGMWAGAAICPLLVEKKKQKNREIYSKNGVKFGEEYINGKKGKNTSPSLNTKF